MGYSHRPDGAALRVPSLAPLTQKKLRYASGEFRMEIPAKDQVAVATVRNMFESELPQPHIDLERKGPISGPKGSAAVASREMEATDFDGASRLPAAPIELQFVKAHASEMMFPKPAPLPRGMAAEEGSGVRAIPPPPTSALERKTPTTIATGIPTSALLRRPDTSAIIAAFAGYGVPPRSLWETPSYALHVRARKKELARELTYAKRGRSPDVALFEAALNAYDTRAARNGMTLLTMLAVTFVGLVVAAVALI